MPEKRENMDAVLRQYIRKIIVEAKLPEAETVANAIIASIAKIGLGAAEAKKISDEEIRIAPLDPHVFSSEEIENVLRKAKLKLVKAIPKGSPGSISGRFMTYVISAGGTKHNVIFTSGRNVGQQFEDQISKEAQDMVKGKISPRLMSLLDEMNIDPKDIKDTKQTGGSNSKRPISNEIKNVGSIISDLTLVLKNGDNVFISLKNPAGNTFANTGYAGGFIETTDKKGNPVIKSGSHPTDQFLIALGVNKNLAAKGFTNYLNGNKTPVAKPVKRISAKDIETVEAMEPVGSQDYEKVQRYLASGYGYGYWYARDMGDGKWHLEDIIDENAALDLVGQIKRIDISYPGVSKQISCNILTTKGKFIVEVRNTQGDVVPNQVNIRVG